MCVNTIITINEYCFVLFFLRNKSLQMNECLLYIDDVIGIHNIQVNVLVFMNYGSVYFEWENNILVSTMYFSFSLKINN